MRTYSSPANGEDGGSTITRAVGHRIKFCDYIDGDNTWYDPEHSC